MLPTIEEWFSIGVDFPFGGYLFYVCFGAVIAKCKLKRWFYYICYFLGGFSAIFIITKYDNHYLFGNKSLAVCLMSMSIFLIVSGIKVKQNKYILKISECTLGIYLLHPLFINLAIKLFKIDLLTTLPYIKLLVFFGLITVVAFICTFILRKIPLIKAIF